MSGLDGEEGDETGVGNNTFGTGLGDDLLLDDEFEQGQSSSTEGSRASADKV